MWVRLPCWPDIWWSCRSHSLKPPAGRWPTCVYTVNIRMTQQSVGSGKRASTRGGYAEPYGTWCRSCCASSFTFKASRVPQHMSDLSASMLPQVSSPSWPLLDKESAWTLRISTNTTDSRWNSERVLCTPQPPLTLLINPSNQNTLRVPSGQGFQRLFP